MVDFYCYYRSLGYYRLGIKSIRWFIFFGSVLIDFLLNRDDYGLWNQRRLSRSGEWLMSEYEHKKWANLQFPLSLRYSPIVPFAQRNSTRKQILKMNKISVASWQAQYRDIRWSHPIAKSASTLKTCSQIYSFRYRFRSLFSAKSLSNSISQVFG